MNWRWVQGEAGVIPRAMSDGDRRFMRKPGESGFDVGLSTSSVLLVRRYERSSDSTYTASITSNTVRHTVTIIGLGKDSDTKTHMHDAVVFIAVVITHVPAQAWCMQ